MDKVSFFILNIFFNSLLAFFTAILLVEAILFIFRIQQGRVAALLRMIPILKLPLDLFFYDFSRWAYMQGINPLNCEKGTRTLSVLFGWTNSSSDYFFLPINSVIQFTVPGNMTFTISDLIGYAMNLNHLKIFSLCLVCLSVCFFVRKLVVYYRSTKTLKLIAIHSKPMTKKICNRKLSALIKKEKYAIFDSFVLNSSPFVAGLFSSIIYIPSHLSKCLSKKEYEAVLAHEIEHIRNRDIFIRLILDMIGSIFWWIPMKWLRNKIEEGQEISCDDQCRKYGVDFVDLASAIWKSAKCTKNHSTHAFAHHLAQHKILKRVKMLLEPSSKRFQKLSFIGSCLAASIALLLIFFGRFWMF